MNQSFVERTQSPNKQPSTQTQQKTQHQHPIPQKQPQIDLSQNQLILSLQKDTTQPLPKELKLQLITNFFRMVYKKKQKIKSQRISSSSKRLKLIKI